MIGLYGITGFQTSKYILTPLMPVPKDNLLTSYIFIKDKKTKKVYNDFIVLVYKKEVDKDYMQDYIYNFVLNGLYYYVFRIADQSNHFKDAFKNILCYENNVLKSKYSNISEKSKEIIIKSVNHFNLMSEEKQLLKLETARILHPKNSIKHLAKRLTIHTPQDYKSMLELLNSVGEYGSVINIEAETLYLTNELVENILKAEKYNVTAF